MSAARKARRSKMTKPLFKKRQGRTRYRLSSHGTRPRLSVFRSGKHIYAQVIDDAKAVTLAAASTAEKDSAGNQGGAGRDSVCLPRSRSGALWSGGI